MQFSSYQNNLSAMVSLVGHKIDHKVHYIGGDIGPRNAPVQRSPLIKTGLE